MMELAERFLLFCAPPPDYTKRLCPFDDCIRETLHTLPFLTTMVPMVSVKDHVSGSFLFFFYERFSFLRCTKLFDP